MRRVRLVSAPWLFRLPWFRRFDGYTMWDLILVRMPVRTRPATSSPTSSATSGRCSTARWPCRLLPVPRLRPQPNEVEARAAAAGHAEIVEVVN